MSLEAQFLCASISLHAVKVFYNSGFLKLIHVLEGLIFLCLRRVKSNGFFLIDDNPSPFMKQYAS